MEKNPHDPFVDNGLKPSRPYNTFVCRVSPPIWVSLLSYWLLFLSKRALNVEVFSDWTSILDSLFQGFTTLCEKTFLLWSFLDHFLKIFLPLISSGSPLSVLIWKNLSVLTSNFLVNILKVSIISLLNLRSTRLVNPKSLSLWSYEKYILSRNWVVILFTED